MSPLVTHRPWEGTGSPKPAKQYPNLWIIFLLSIMLVWQEEWEILNAEKLQITEKKTPTFSRGIQTFQDAPKHHLKQV